ncbi:phosphopantetheine-binding protein [Rathayibacter tritici]|uniref:Polyketide biosynthesis acyl-carrier-protein AcpK n=1 Tax=Rathayibacter tritici TaxID=33888 RepID=A0A160KQS7_9MICO|nr:phosphopantetheine-binding protein [Rathayibacter tritici]AND15930.1 Polyketide biosynthesis acyl-carrier-protein AcpK [Rathayibacter tritici]PPI41069.1 acyl carrier protein [Rathayibacter tritici]
MTVDDIRSLIEQAVRQVVPGIGERRIDASDSLEALGADSMDRADIVMDVLAGMQLRVPLVETFGPRDIGELATRLHALSGQSAQRRG